MWARFHAALLPLTCVVPATSFMYFHHRGGTVKLLEMAYRFGGVPGLLALPAISMSMEKVFYDTVSSDQGIDPNMAIEGADPLGAFRSISFPNGGHMLPSLSLLPVNRNGFYFDQSRQSPSSPHYIDASRNCWREEWWLDQRMNVVNFICGDMACSEQELQQEWDEMSL